MYSKDNINYISEGISFAVRLAYGVLLVNTFSSHTSFWLYVGFTGLTAFLAYGDLGFVSIAVKNFNSRELKGDLRSFNVAILVGLFVATIVSVIACWFYLHPEVYYSGGNLNVNTLAALTVYTVLQSYILVFKGISEALFKAELNIVFYNRLNIAVYIIMILYFLGLNCRIWRTDSLHLIGLQTFLYGVIVLVSIVRLLKVYGRRLYQVFSFDKSIFKGSLAMNGYAVIATLSWFAYSDMDRIFLSTIGDKNGLVLIGILLIIVNLVRPIFGILSRQVPVKYNLLWSGNRADIGMFIYKVRDGNMFWSVMVLSVAIALSPSVLSIVSTVHVPSYIVNLAILGMAHNVVGQLFTAIVEAHNLAKAGIALALLRTVLFVLGLLVFGVSLENIILIRFYISMLYIVIYAFVIRFYTKVELFNFKIILFSILTVLTGLVVQLLILEWFTVGYTVLFILILFTLLKNKGRFYLI